MKFKVGDYAQPKDGRAKECGMYNYNGSYIKITELFDDCNYTYEIYDYHGKYINWCRPCFKDADLQPYTPTPDQLEAEIEEAVEEPKQTKPQLTYTKHVGYMRSDGTIFGKEKVVYNNELILVETLRLHSNLYKAWKGRKFDE
jgi:hypothetical protein